MEVVDRADRIFQELLAAQAAAKREAAWAKPLAEFWPQGSRVLSAGAATKAPAPAAAARPGRHRALSCPPRPPQGAMLPKGSRGSAAGATERSGAVWPVPGRLAPCTCLQVAAREGSLPCPAQAGLAERCPLCFGPSALAPISAAHGAHGGCPGGQRWQSLPTESALEIAERGSVSCLACCALPDLASAGCARRPLRRASVGRAFRPRTRWRSPTRRRRPPRPRLRCAPAVCWLAHAAHAS